MKKDSLHPSFPRIAARIAGMGTLLLAAPALAQDAGDGAASTAETTEASAAAGESEFGEPLVVNGERISDLAIKRFLVYGPGRNALEARQLQILMDHERDLRRREVRDDVLDEMPDLGDEEIEEEVDERMERFDYDPGAVDRRLAKEKEGFEELYPTLDHETNLRRLYQSGDWYRDQVRQTTEFDQLFFPDHPDTWPALTIEALNQGAPNVDIIDNYRQEYERRVAVAEETGEPIVPEQEMMMSIMRDFVMSALWSMAEVRTGSDGIPEDVAMEIVADDWSAEIMTEDVYSEMENSFSAQDVADAKLALALMTAARQKLEEEGALVDFEEFRTTVVQQKDAMEGGMLNFNFVATQAHGFPSSEAYEQHYYLLESYRGFVGDKLEVDEEGNISPELEAHLPVANGIMGLAKAHADTLLVSSFDFENHEWIENGWEKAYERAWELRWKIDEHLAKLEDQRQAQEKAAAAGEKFIPSERVLPFDQWWSAFLREHSDFWDPPMPETGKGPPEFSLRNYGAFQDKPKTRNDLKRAIGESEYEHFLANSAIVDKIFYEMEESEVAGPWRGPRGYYIIYLKRKIPPVKSLNPKKEDDLANLREDWLRKSFQRFAHEALAQAELQGL